MLATHVKEMAEAISANVDYLKKTQVATVYLENGQLLRTQAKLFVYHFDCNFANRVDLDRQVDFFVGRQNFVGRLVGMTPKSIDIGLPENLGRVIPKAKIAIGNYYLLEQLKDRLTASKTRHPLGDELLEIKSSPKPSSLELVGLDQIGVNLNAYQQAALEAVNKQRITYIWGPPGTGKTKTIASIVEALITNGLSVLLLSHTNIATDEALYKTACQLQDRQNTNLNKGRIIRVGNIQHTKLLDEFKSQVTIDEIVAGRIQSIKERIESCRADIAQATEESRSLEQLKSQLANHQHLLGQIRDKQAAIVENEARGQRARQRLARLGPEIAATQQQASEVASKGGWGQAGRDAPSAQVATDRSQAARGTTITGARIGPARS